jgi:hypothetical protein
VATDYDAPRKEPDEPEPLVVPPREQSGDVDVDENEAAEAFELPGADLSGHALTVTVVPVQADEFTCASCFLVHHRSQVAATRDGHLICTDCA